MRLGFGPYADWASEEVMARNPRYVDFPIEEARRGNLKGIFIHWATGRTVGNLLGLADKVAVVGEPVTPEQ